MIVYKIHIFYFIVSYVSSIYLMYKIIFNYLDFIILYFNIIS